MLKSSFFASNPKGRKEDFFDSPFREGKIGENYQNAQRVQIFLRTYFRANNNVLKLGVYKICDKN